MAMNQKKRASASNAALYTLFTIGAIVVVNLIATRVFGRLDLTEANADGTHGVPMPTVAIIDSAGIIRWIDVHPDYTTRSEPEQILAALDRLEGRS